MLRCACCCCLCGNAVEQREVPNWAMSLSPAGPEVPRYRSHKTTELMGLRHPALAGSIQRLGH